MIILYDFVLDMLIYATYIPSFLFHVICSTVTLSVTPPPTLPASRKFTHTHVQAMHLKAAHQYSVQRQAAKP